MAELASYDYVEDLKESKEQELWVYSQLEFILWFVVALEDLRCYEMKLKKVSFLYQGVIELRDLAFLNRSLLLWIFEKLVHFLSSLFLDWIHREEEEAEEESAHFREVFDNFTKRLSRNCSLKSFPLILNSHREQMLNWTWILPLLL